jgi:hypothetical protein
MRGRAIAAWLVVTLAAVGAPGSASAAHGPTESLGKAGSLEYLRTKLTDVKTQAGPETACKGTDQIAGGGAAIGGKPNRSHLNSSGLGASTDSWLGEGRTSHGSETVTSWAICGPATTTEITSTDMLGTSQYNAGFSCNPGESLSGGVTSADGDVLVSGLFPDDGQSDIFDWVDSYQNVSSTTTTVQSSVVCSADYAVERMTADVKAKPGSAAKAIAECGHGEAIAGGGLWMSVNGIGQDDVSAQATRPWDSKDKDKTPDDGWFAKSFNGTGAKVTLTSYASCVPRS